MMRGYEQKKALRPRDAPPLRRVVVPGELLPRLLRLGGKLLGHQRRGEPGPAFPPSPQKRGDPVQALPPPPGSYQRTTMRKHTKGGYANVLDELWIVCKQYNADMVLMYDQISCKGMDGLRGVFEEQAAARRAHALGRAGSARFTHDLQARHAPPGQPLHADRHGRGARAARPCGL